ncbi:MAG: AraC family transcriptional regulator, partial [Planctomycetota bacterium]|nr:AraC family transcriptional regulator [Planctomycetota bacterium]
HLRVGPAWGFPQRRVQDAHLIYVSSGHGRYFLGDEVVPLEPGRLIFVSPGYRYGAEAERRDPPWITPLRFRVEAALPRGAGPAWQPAPCALHTRLEPAQRAGLMEVCHAVHQAWLAGGDEHQRALRLQTGVISMLLALSLAMESQGLREEDPFEPVVRAIRADPARRWAVPGMARAVGLSEKHFIRAFRARYGSTPRRFQIEARCELAAFLLAETRDSVASIAEHLGYPDTASFSKQFRQQRGRSPAAWRRDQTTGPLVTERVRL